MVAPIDLSQINFFTPIASFLFVFVIVYAILQAKKLISDEKAINLFVSFVMSIIFLSFASSRLYVESIIPWFVVLLVIVFLILLIAGFSAKDLDKIMTKQFAWGVIIVLLVAFIIVAINVFNPIFHPDRILVSGDSPQVVSQIVWFVFYSKWAGSVLLLIIAGVVAWVVTKK